MTRALRDYIIFAAALMLVFASVARGQTTKPVQVLAFFEPARNIPTLAAMGFTVFCGPEIENAKALTADQLTAARGVWFKAVAEAGAKCIIKNPVGPLPATCVGIMLTVDEPNGRNVLPATMMAESIAYRQNYPGIPLYLSLAGDKVSSANFDRTNERQLYLDYAALADVLTTDFYEKNRNAGRYPDTMSGDIVKKLATLTGKPVVPWLEMNDQYVLPLPKPEDGISRAPTADEIKTKADYALKQGAYAIGWFATSQSNKYGWGVKDATKGDSYWPLVDRNGTSIRPQLDMVAAINKSLAPIPSPPATQPDPITARVDGLQKTVDGLRLQLIDGQRLHEKQVADLTAALADTTATLDRLRQALQPATRPAGVGQ